MSTRLLYYSGTGNSLWVARELGKRLGDAELTNLVPTRERPVLDAEAIGLVFPVHIWGLPKRIVEFAEHLPQNAPGYFFAIAVNAGEPAATLLRLKKLMARHGVVLAAGFSVPLPSNYIPWGGPGPKARQERLFAEAREKFPVIAEAIRARRVQPPEKGPWWQNLLYSGLLYPLSYPHIPEMDKDFRADDKCNGCGICARICPAKNIRLENQRPHWLHRCEQCLACIQWCPEQAIQYGQKTSAYERYHNPEIRLADVHHWTAEQMKEA